MINIINDFKERKVKARQIFEVRCVGKEEAKNIVKTYHYLGGKAFMCTVAYGLYLKNHDEMLGCAIFGTISGTATIKGWFGLDNTHTKEFFELTRLVMNPILNGCNATSYLLGNSIKQIKKDFPKIRAIMSLADNERHNGAIYQACNFKYYGLSNKKSVFYPLDQKGGCRRCGSTSDKQGVWLPRSQKHRYLYIIDETLEVKYDKEEYPKGNDMNVKPSCCDGTKVVYDKRSGKKYTCPKCCEIFEEILDF